MSATMLNIQEAIALEQLRKLESTRTPSKGQVKRDIQMYRGNPEAYSTEQIVELAQRAAEVGIPFEPKTSGTRMMKNIAYGVGSGATFGLLGLIPGLKPDALTGAEQSAKGISELLGLAVGGPAALGGKIASKAVGAAAKVATGAGRVAKVTDKVNQLSSAGKQALEQGIKYGFAGTMGTVADEGLNPGRGVMMGGGAAAISAMRAAKLGQQVQTSQAGQPNFTMQGGSPVQTNVSKELFKAQGTPYTGPVASNQSLVPTQGLPAGDASMVTGNLGRGRVVRGQLPPRQFEMGAGQTTALATREMGQLERLQQLIGQLPKGEQQRVLELIRQLAGN